MSPVLVTQIHGDTVLCRVDRGTPTIERSRYPFCVSVDLHRVHLDVTSCIGS